VIDVVRVRADDDVDHRRQSAPCSEIGDDDPGDDQRPREHRRTAPRDAVLASRACQHRERDDGEKWNRDGLSTIATPPRRPATNAPRAARRARRTVTKAAKENAAHESSHCAVFQWSK